MTNETRYEQMACSCGSQWIEDRMQLGPTCPFCGHHERWDSVEGCSRLFIEGPGEFDMSATELIALLERCAFTGSLTKPKRGRVDVGRWVYDHKDGDTGWKLLIDIEVFKDHGGIRSVLLSYWVDGKPALDTTAVSADGLLDTVATIVRSIQWHSRSPVPSVEGLFCCAPVEAA
jgi:hypothetical protein